MTRYPTLPTLPAAPHPAVRTPSKRGKAAGFHSTIADQQRSCRAESVDRDFSFLSLIGSPAMEGQFDDAEIESPMRRKRVPGIPQPDSDDDAFRSAEEYFSADEYRTPPKGPRAMLPKKLHSKSRKAADDGPIRCSANTNSQKRPLFAASDGSLSSRGRGKPSKKQTPKGRARETEWVRMPAPEVPRSPRRAQAEFSHRAVETQRPSSSHSYPGQSQRSENSRPGSSHSYSGQPPRHENPRRTPGLQSGRGRQTPTRGNQRMPPTPAASRESSFGSSSESRMTASTASSSFDRFERGPSKPNRFEPGMLYDYRDVPTHDDTEEEEETYTHVPKVASRRGKAKATAPARDKGKAKETITPKLGWVPELTPPEEPPGYRRREPRPETPQRKAFDFEMRPPTPDLSDDEVAQLERLKREFEESPPVRRIQQAEKTAVEDWEDDEEALREALRKDYERDEAPGLSLGCDGTRLRPQPTHFPEQEVNVEEVFFAEHDLDVAEGFEDNPYGPEHEDDRFSVTESLLAGMAELEVQSTPAYPSQSSQSSLASQPRSFETFQYLLQWEVTRMSLALGIPLCDLEYRIPDVVEPFAYDLHHASTPGEQWRVLKEFARQIPPKGSRMRAIEPLPNNVWQKFKENKGWSNNFELTAKASFIEGSNPPEIEIALNPPSLERKSNKFAARFGSDRFLTIRVPTVHPRKYGADAERKQMVEWFVRKELRLLNRTWKCFYIRDAGKKVKENSKDKETYLLAYFFAESGVGLGSISHRAREQLGFVEDEKLNRTEMSRDDLIRWHIPIEQQLDEDFSKIWSRISLGLSSSTPTITFEPHQIEIVKETKSPAGNTMNDGCSVCSPKVMRIIREKLDLAETPTAVQGRLGGAKGVWFVDPEADRYSEEIKITINKSQLKYRFHEEDHDVETYDWARMTLFVLNCSKEPTPTTLNLQLVPILSRQGVPFEAFKELLETHLEEDLEQLFQAANNRLTLRHWLSGHGLEGRFQAGEIKTTNSGTPLCQEEQMAMLLDAGFDPVECNFLMEKLLAIIKQNCDKILEKLHIRVPCSAFVYCVADPTGTLEEGEVSLQFSKGFLDPVTHVRDECIIGDVLVARNPAHLPTDIQKVRAVRPTHPGLTRLKDVIVFSSRGDIPLADMLSGGDYDGDKPWVCWDHRLVRPFKNSPNFASFKRWSASSAPAYFEPSSTLRRLRDLGDTQNASFFETFFRRGFESEMQENLLGFCTSVLERYTYFRPRDKQQATDSTTIRLANMCGVLVDAPKQGLRPTEKAVKYLRELSQQYWERPLYKDPNSGKKPEGPVEEWYLLDRLVLDVGRRKVDAKKAQFVALKEHKTHMPDPHLSKLYISVDNEARNNPPLRKLLNQLHADLEEVKKTWDKAMAGYIAGEQFRTRVEPVWEVYKRIEPLPVGVQRWEVAEQWNLLKASRLWSLYYYGSSLPWWMAMPELCQMKANEVAKGGKHPLRVVCSDVYYLLKPVQPEVEEGEEDE